MKKLLTLILVGTMALSLAACKKNDSKQDGLVSVTLRQNIAENDLKDSAVDEHSPEHGLKNVIYADTLNDAVSTIRSGRADNLFINSDTAKYLSARDNTLKIVETDAVTTLHILSLTKKAEMNEKINSAIKALEADHTLNKLYSDYVTTVIEAGEPASIEMPVFEGKDSLVIGVSGDLPPIDYVNTNGEPVGYNMAVLAEIAKKLEVNIKIEVIDSGSRFAALSSERIDAFFWQSSDNGIELTSDQTEYSLSEPYAKLNCAVVMMK